MITVSETVIVETIHVWILVLHTVCRSVKWFGSLVPTFCWPISLNDKNFWVQRSKMSSKCFMKVILLSKMIKRNFMWAQYEQRSPYEDLYQALPWLHFWTRRILWIGFFLHLVLFCISHTTLSVNQSSFANILLPNQYFYSRPAWSTIATY